MQQYADIYLLRSDFAVNKYLHTVASGWLLLTLNHDTRNYELEIWGQYTLHVKIAASEVRASPTNRPS